MDFLMDEESISSHQSTGISVAEKIEQHHDGSGSGGGKTTTTMMMSIDESMTAVDTRLDTIDEEAQDITYDVSMTYPSKGSIKVDALSDALLVDGHVGKEESHPFGDVLSQNIKRNGNSLPNVEAELDSHGEKQIVDGALPATIQPEVTSAATSRSSATTNETLSAVVAAAAAAASRDTAALEEDGTNKTASAASVNVATATPCHTETTAASYSRTSQATSTHPGTGSGNATFATVYGRPVPVTDSGGSFPQAGSVLGPYFCLGQLGKGTFSSIHKCVNMEYYHTNHLPPLGVAPTGKDKRHQTSVAGPNSRRRRRVAAAKVELGSFQQSGVLEAEAIILEFLCRNVPAGTVPVYMGHYRSEKFAAILMEYLKAEDMHQMRERVMAGGGNGSSSSSTRRISTNDAIYFTADVMLPLLRRMHEVGVVHRDVKPSNCVRQSNTSREFCIVDFGLSKSIVVPEDSEFANREHPWDENREWLKPLNYKGKRGYYRMERLKADFRGTSMYASLRVHQEKDYCPRDDIWSLLYVFCDLVSGGLPWMSHAANRNRAECQRLKEWVHADGEQKDDRDHTDELLKGDAYHVAKYRWDRLKDTDPAKRLPLPAPLHMSTNETLVDQLRQSFRHLATLEFWDIPDYDLIRRSILSFRTEKNVSSDPPIEPINWDELKVSADFPDKQDRATKGPVWKVVDEGDVDGALESNIFDDAESEAKMLRRSDDIWSRLPISLRFHLSQMEFNMRAAEDGTIPPNKYLQDWMTVVLPLLYDEWDAKKYEDGGHRTSTDGFKRMHYLNLLKKCDLYARKFHNFQEESCYYEEAEIKDDQNGFNDALISTASSQESAKANGSPRKRRKVHVHVSSGKVRSNDLVFVSRALVGLRLAIKMEQTKRSPPPVRISFG